MLKAAKLVGLATGIADDRMAQASLGDPGGGQIMLSRRQVATMLARKFFVPLTLGASMIFGVSTLAIAQVCPKTLSPSCVRWSLYDNSLHWWDLHNSCGRAVSVTYNAGAGLETTPNFGPGERVRVTVRTSDPPSYVVWDSTDAMRFYRDRPPGAQLECLRSL